jgi:hypothetical protein
LNLLFSLILCQFDLFYIMARQTGHVFELGQNMGKKKR